MRSKKIFKPIILFCALCISFVSIFSACDFNKSDDSGNEKTHSHVWAECYSSDENQHWKICTTCGETTEKQNHQFKGNTCTICGYIEDDGPKDVNFTDLLVKRNENGKSVGSSEEYTFMVSDCIPGLVLTNTPLTVTTSSNTNVYLVIVYKVKAVDEFSGENIDCDISDHLIDVKDDTILYDGRFTYTDEENPEHNTDFRYIMIPTPIAPTQNPITVIPEDKLMVHLKMGNKYQSAVLTFNFRAYVIDSDAESLKNELDKTNGSTEGKCNVVMNAIYQAYDFNL